MLHQAFPPVNLLLPRKAEVLTAVGRISGNTHGETCGLAVRSTVCLSDLFAVCSSEPVGSKPFLSLSLTFPFFREGSIRNFSLKGLPGDFVFLKKGDNTPFDIFYSIILTQLFSKVKLEMTVNLSSFRIFKHQKGVFCGYQASKRAIFDLLELVLNAFLSNDGNHLLLCELF